MELWLVRFTPLKWESQQITFLSKLLQILLLFCENCGVNAAAVSYLSTTKQLQAPSLMQLVWKGTYVLMLPSESIIISSRSSLQSFFHPTCECILDLTCLFGCTLIFSIIFFLLPTPFRICSSSATDLWSGFPPTFLAYLPPSPGSYVLSCRINISDPQPHSSAVKVCIWVFFPYIPFGTVDTVQGGRPFTQECRLMVQFPAGGIYKGATICTPGCTSCLLSHFPLTSFHCPLTRDAADISGRLVNSRSDSGWEGLGGWRSAVWINKSWGRFERMWNWSHLLMKPMLIRCRVAISGRGGERKGWVQFSLEVQIMLKLILLKAVAASPEGALMPDAQYAPTTPRKKKKSSIYWLKALPVLIQGSSGVQDGLTPPQVIASYLRLKSAALRNTYFSFLQLYSTKTVEGHSEMQLQENRMLFLWDRQIWTKMDWKRVLFVRVGSVEKAGRIKERKTSIDWSVWEVRRAFFFLTGDTVVTLKVAAPKTHFT